MGQTFECVPLNNNPIFIQLQLFQTFKTRECGVRNLLQPAVDEIKTRRFLFSQRQLGNIAQVRLLNNND